MKLLGSTETKIDENKNGKNLCQLEITEVVLIHCNTVNSDYQCNSWVLCTFAPSRSFGHLLETLPKTFIFLKTFISEFSYIDLWFTDQNCKPLEIEDKISITLVIN